MKVIAFNGSPRGRESNSHIIIAPLLEGAREAGAETEEIFLVDRDVKQCRGCFYCWQVTPGECVIEDEMSELLKLYLEADYAGMATPVYNLFMTGLLKNFVDRFLPLATPHIHKNEDGTFYHEGRVQKFPREFFIANSGFPGPDNFELLKMLMDYKEPVLEIYRNSGEVLSSSRESIPDYSLQKIDDFKLSLQEAGREMVEEGEVSGELVQRLHEDLIDDGDYMRLANEEWDEMLKYSGNSCEKY